jgi:ATPase subunit of ABC transporter with duplicated ATPase domains
VFLSFSHVTFGYPGSPDPAFDDLHLTLGRGWTGVVGANGSGKTTLLRLAIGELEFTSGSVLRPPGSARYCPQRTDDEPGGWREFLGTCSSDAFRLRDTLGVQDDWRDRWQTLSHGERKRAQIAVALAGRPDCLVVDEPTNHLDRETRDMVEQALLGFHGIGLLVSHDRDLLDTLCRQCLFLEAGTAVLRPGGYSQGARDAAIDRETLARTRDAATREAGRLQREVVRRREQAAKAERGRSKRGLTKGDHDAREKINVARLKDSGSGAALRQLEGRLRQAEERAADLSVRRRFALGVTLGGARSPRRTLLHVPQGFLRLSDARTVSLPSLVIGPGDRIGLQGPNGAGKSTLLRLIVRGMEERGVRVAYIPQEIDASESAEILARFKALPPDALGRAMTLVRRLGSDPARLLQSREPSPGELRKLLLAASIEAQPHIVVLDEPTNHLDLPSVECLESALDGCTSALLMVSHDARFLQTLATRMWHIERDRSGTWELQEQI